MWKHYYCLPKDIWDATLLTKLPPVSGVLLMYNHRVSGNFHVSVERMAVPDRTADHISAEDAVDIARLASLRMWDAYQRLDDRKREP